MNNIRSTNDYRGYYNNHNEAAMEEIKAEIKADYSKNDYRGYYNNHHNEATSSQIPNNASRSTANSK